jgi:hypothetical protein
MPSLEHTTNVAARMGRWSARRRKTASSAGSPSSSPPPFSATAVTIALAITRLNHRAGTKTGCAV